MQDRFVPGGPSDKRPSEGPHAFTTHAGDGPGDTPDILQQIVKEKKADGDTSRNTGKTSARRPLDILRHIMKEQNRAPDDKGGKKLEKALKVLNREAPRNKNIDGKKKTLRQLKNYREIGMYRRKDCVKKRDSSARSK